MAKSKRNRSRNLEHSLWPSLNRNHKSSGSRLLLSSLNHNLYPSCSLCRRKCPVLSLVPEPKTGETELLPLTPCHHPRNGQVVLRRQWSRLSIQCHCRTNQVD